MMALDPINNLDKFPLTNLNDFVEACIQKNVNEINVTGSNTDPLLYQYLPELKQYLKTKIPNLVFGIRTNGVKVIDNPDWRLFDKGSISITSFNETIYRKTMGCGSPPNLEKILEQTPFPLKINIVLCPEITKRDLIATLDHLADLEIRRVNLREPYGQPHVGDPMHPQFARMGEVHGMPIYWYRTLDVVYWDVHYVEVESVNLYANGQISLDYPVTRGHCPETGEVLDQSHFVESGRVTEQWSAIQQSE